MRKALLVVDIRREKALWGAFASKGEGETATHIQLYPSAIKNQDGAVILPFMWREQQSDYPSCRGGYRHMTILCESCHANHEAHVNKECSLIAWFVVMITPFDPTPVGDTVEWTRYRRKEYGETTTVVWRRVLA